MKTSTATALLVSVVSLGACGGDSADESNRGPAPDPEAPAAPRIGTPQSRAELFDTVLARTERREAFSPLKEEAMDFSPMEEMAALRSDVVAASTEEELFYALVKLSNARRDHHLEVTTVPGGLEVPPVADVRAPITVLPDYSDPARPAFFIASVDADAPGIEGEVPSPGELIVAVNGRSIPQYVEAFRPWVVHSSIPGLYWDMARDMPLRPPYVAPWMYEDRLTLELERGSGLRHTVSLPYLDPADLEIPAAEEPIYPGFRVALERFDFNVLLPEDGRPIVLLQWFDFEDGLIQDVVDLMELAQHEGLLNHTLVIDVTDSSGGSRGAYAIQRLVDRPFRTTFGNIRLSDAGADLIGRWASSEPDAAAPDVFGLNESGSWLIEWARADATAALERGDEYTASVPFKLAHLPKDSDGVLQPAPVHFSAPIAILSGPRGGSHLDQFVSMFVDNDLASTVGMPTGGYSNTWEADEVLTMPGSGQPLVRFMWNVGHTFRPNGEILEGNPPVPHRWIPLARDNYAEYHAILLDAALDAVG